MGRQQLGCRLPGTLQRGAVDRRQRNRGQGLTGAPGLADAFRGEGGEVLPALDALLLVEAAQTMAHQHDP